MKNYAEKKDVAPSELPLSAFAAPNLFQEQ
jgi:hypothetical protein